MTLGLVFPSKKGQIKRKKGVYVVIFIFFFLRTVFNLLKGGSVH